MSLYDDYMNETEVPVVFADYSGTITAINQRFEELYLWPANEIVGKPLNTIIPENLRDAHNMGFSKYMVSGQPTLLNTPLELYIQLGNGETILAEHFIVDLKDHGKELVAAKIIPK